MGLVEFLILNLFGLFIEVEILICISENGIFKSKSMENNWIKIKYVCCYDDYFIVLFIVILLNCVIG